MIDFQKQRQEISEVYFSNETNVKIESDDMNKLIALAKNTTRNRARFCSHSTANETVHEMFIVHPESAYIRPHKHINKSESMLVLQGEVDYITFDKNGKIADIESMGDYMSGKTFYTKIHRETYHSLVIRSEWLVFLEITEGPFYKEDTLFASWSPDETNIEDVKIFLHKLKENYQR